jgi:hypothetical protein
MSAVRDENRGTQASRTLLYGERVPADFRPKCAMREVLLCVICGTWCSHSLRYIRFLDSFKRGQTRIFNL